MRSAQALISATGLAGAVLASSCTFTLPYPDGPYPEASAAVCSDGRDQDADGLVDQADPGCWPFAATTSTRCVSTPASEWTAGFVSGEWIETGTHVAYEPDPTGRFAHSVVRFPGMGELTTLVAPSAVTGAIEGMVASISIRGTASWTILLRSIAATPPGAPEEIHVSFVSGFAELVLFVDGELRYDLDSTVALPTADWVDATLTLTGSAMDVHFADATGAPLGELHWEHGATLSPNAAYRLEVSAQSGAVLGAASVRRDALLPCETPYPVADPNSLARGQLVAIARSPEMTCAIVTSHEGPFVRSARALDGRTFTPGERVASSNISSGTAPWPCGSLAWDPERGAFVALMRVYDGPTPADLVFARSADCLTWTAADAPTLPAGSVVATCPDYTIDTDPDGVPRHEIWGTRAEAEALTLTHLSSVDPSGPWRDEPDIATTLHASSTARVLAFPRDLVVSRVEGGAVAFAVLDRRSAHATEWWREAASRVEGACDASSLVGPIPFRDPRAPGHVGLAHGCSDRSDAYASIAIREIEVQ